MFNVFTKLGERARKQNADISYPYAFVYRVAFSIVLSIIIAVIALCVLMFLVVKNTNDINKLQKIEKTE